MNLKERMADAEFGIKTPICCYCLNRIRHKYSGNPDEPTLTCKVLGLKPEEVSMYNTEDCKAFLVDSEEKKICDPIL